MTQEIVFCLSEISVNDMPTLVGHFVLSFLEILKQEKGM